MYRRMLVPLDGSELSEVVFPYAKELARRLNLDVILLHVQSPEERGLAPLHRAYIEHKAEIIKHQIEELQKGAGIGAGGKTAQVRGELAMGYPAEEILRYADENEIDLILMATHGRSGIRRWVMGSVADKVLHVSNVPVWLVRAGAPEKITYDKWPKITILVPLDGSELAERVLPHVEALAKQPGTEPVDVVLLSVSEPPVKSGSYFPEVPVPPEELKKYLDEVEKRLKSVGVGVRSEVLAGHPAEQIVDYANANPFSLIVMSTHARSGLSRWACGSVAVKVLQRASSPIFLVRPH